MSAGCKEAVRQVADTCAADDFRCIFGVTLISMCFMKTLALCCILMLAGGGFLASSFQAEPSGSHTETAEMTSLAFRVHHLEPMLDFYRESFGIRFRQVDTFGIESWFGELDGLLIKFVPIREGADFEGYPFHQPGFRVADVRKVIALAEKYGGRKEGPIRQSEGETQAAVRDPDGNTIELYQRP